MLAGFVSLVKTLGLQKGLEAFAFASLEQLKALLNGDGNYPEPGKRRVWFKLHFMRGVYEFLLKDDEQTALSNLEMGVLSSAVAFIGEFVPPAKCMNRDVVLHEVWKGFVENDYNVEATIDPVDGSSVSLRVTRCFINEVIRDLGLLSLADIICGTDFRFWDGYHPNVRFSRTKTLLAGDDVCNHTLTWLE
jgi:hypothetical protein